MEIIGPHGKFFWPSLTLSLSEISASTTYDHDNDVDANWPLHYGRHDNIIINSFIFLQISILGLMLWSKNFVVFKHVTSNRRLERRDHIWFYMIYERICEAHNLELRFVWHAVFVKKNFFPGLSSQRHSKAYRFLLLKLWLPPVAVFHLLILIRYQILPQKVKYIQI